jgi:hypothetical protein
VLLAVRVVRQEWNGKVSLQVGLLVDCKADLVEVQGIKDLIGNLRSYKPGAYRMERRQDQSLQDLIDRPPRCHPLVERVTFQ